MVSPANSKRRHLKTFLVALLCLSGAAKSAHLLYLDFNQSGADGQGTPMAKVEKRESKVRRKPSKSFAWNNAAQEEKLYLKDSVQTGVGSAAAIRFNDGTLLEMGENSLVVIDDLQNLSLNFLKGAVVLHTAEGDKRVTVDKDGKAKFEELPIRLVKPEPLSRFFTAANASKPIRFEWKPRAGQENALPQGLSIQVSPDRGFKSARVRTVALSEPGVLQSDIELPEGSYFWRLAAGDKPLTDIGQFRVIGASPLQPVSPGGGESLVTFGDETVTPFRWVVPEEGSLASQATHELIVSRTAEFASVVARQEIAASSGLASVRGLPDGEFFWRIQSRYGDLQVASRAERFVIAKAARPELALTLPEDKKAIEKITLLQFAWRSDAQGLEYLFELKDAQGREIVPLARTRAASFAWKNPSPGSYRWRVTAYHKKEAVAQTQWRTFSIFEGARISLRAPARELDLYTWDKPVAFEFEWTEDELIARQPGYSYQVAVSRDADFKAPVFGPRVRVAELSSAKIKLADGANYWRVLVLDEGGQVVKTSDTWRFNYGPYPPLAAPNPLTPAAQEVFDVVATEVNPVASWQELKGAEGYELLLYKVDPGRATANAGQLNPDGMPQGAQLVLKTQTEKTSFEFKNLTEAGYLWSVRAIDRIKRRGQPMRPRNFKVIYGDVLGAPEVTSPEVQ